MGERLRRRWRLPSPQQSVGLQITGLCFSASLQIVGGELARDLEARIACFVALRDGGRCAVSAARELGGDSAPPSRFRQFSNSL
jgi:hypothetical protein